MHPDAFLHTDSGAVRFWVVIDSVPVGTIIRTDTLHHRFAPGRSDDLPLATYQAHATEIAEAVCRRVAAGSIGPVLLREHDLAAPAR